MEKLNKHKHIFDGPVVNYERPYLGGSINGVYSCPTCSICGILQIDYLESKDRKIRVIA